MANELIEKNILKKIRRLQAEKQEILSLPPEKALERILDAAEPAALVHSFSEQDFYFLIHDIGPEDALPIIGMASRRQWEFMFDMELWQRDRMDLSAAAHWIELLNRADPKSSIAWLVKNKTDLLEFFLFNNIEVLLREHDQEASEFAPDYFTLDNVFYVRPHPLRFPPPDESTSGEDAATDPARDFIEKFVRALAEYDYVAYQHLLLEATSLIPAENEEDVYRLRSVRLAEKGFLPFDEAISVYRPLGAEELLQQKSKYIADDPGPELMALVPVTTTSGIDPQNLFARALGAVNSETLLQQMHAEFATLCNQLVVADQKKIQDKKELQPIIVKASGYLSIGLQRLQSTGDDSENLNIEQMAQILERYPLIGIFQVGVRQVLKLKWRAEKWVAQSWFAGKGLALTFWGEDWLGVLGGLLLKKPLFFDNYLSGQMYREYGIMQDIEATSDILDSIIAFDNLLERLDIDLLPVSSYRFLTYKNLLLTLWVRYERNLAAKLVPLSISEFKPFFESLWTDEDTERKIKAQRKTDFLRWLSHQSGGELESLSRQYGQILENLFVEVEAEYAAVFPENLDPRYIHLFLMEK